MEVKAVAKTPVVLEKAALDGGAAKKGLSEFFLSDRRQSETSGRWTLFVIQPINVVEQPHFRCSVVLLL